MTQGGKVPETELLARLMAGPKAHSEWRHYRTEGRYVVVRTVVLESTLEPLVVYRKEFGLVHFARPLSEWQQAVEHEGRPTPRFVPA